MVRTIKGYIKCYNSIMGRTEIDDLIEAATEVKRKWRKPSNEHAPHPKARSWKEILEERQVPVKMRYR